MTAATGTAISSRNSPVCRSRWWVTKVAYRAGDEISNARNSVENRAMPSTSAAHQAQPLAEHRGPLERGRRPTVEQGDRQSQRQRAGRVAAGHRAAQADRI